MTTEEAKQIVKKKYGQGWAFVTYGWSNERMIETAEKIQKNEKIDWYGHDDRKT